MRRRPEPYFIMGDPKDKEKTKNLSKGEKGRARFTMEYKPGGLGFNNADSRIFAEAYSDLISSGIKKQFRMGRDAQGRRRKRKWDDEDTKLERQIHHYLIAQKLKKPKKPAKRGKSELQYQKQTKSWNKKVERWRKNKARQKQLKKKNRYKGKVYDPKTGPQEDGVIWSGLMIDSMNVNKPKASRRTRDKETGRRYWTKGRARISISSKRKWEAYRNKFFEFNQNSPIMRPVKSVHRHLAQRATVRWNHNQRRKLYRTTGRIVLKIIERMIRT